MAGRTEVEIEGFTFYVKKYPALHALKVVGNLQQKIISPAAHFIATQRNEVLSDEGFAKGIQELSKALDGETLLWAYKTLVGPDWVSVRVPEGNGDVVALDEQKTNLYEIPLEVLIALAVEVAKINFLGSLKSASTLIGKGLSQPAK